MRKNIVIIGSSGHAGVIIDIIEKENKYNIIGLLDPYKEIGENSFGYKILGKESNLPEIIMNYQIVGCIIAIGDNWIRNIVKNKINEIDKSISFISAIHPSAIISNNVTIGDGTAIMAGAIIGSNSKIGNFCIVNTKASIDHDSKMEDFSSLAPSATTGGNVLIKEFSAISLGANIIHGINIGKHTIVGANSTVLKNIDDNIVVYGTPTKVIRDRKVGDKYL